MNWVAEFMWLRNKAFRQVVFQLDHFFHPGLCSSAGADGAGEGDSRAGRELPFLCSSSASLHAGTAVAEAGSHRTSLA